MGLCVYACSNDAILWRGQRSHEKYLELFFAKRPYQSLKKQFFWKGFVVLCKYCTHFHTESQNLSEEVVAPMSQCAEIAKEKRCRALWNVMIAPLLMYLVWRYAFLWRVHPEEEMKWNGLLLQTHSWGLCGLMKMLKFLCTDCNLTFTCQKQRLRFHITD